ncbi:MAG: hypothetical protein ACRD33_00030 [Candidatus Acidiferrales bacterium]
MKRLQKCYVFLVRRETDAFIWPCVTARESQAKHFPGRVTPVVGIEFETDIPDPQPAPEVPGIAPE